MKKVTIITFPEYESIVLDSLGTAGVTQLKEVTGTDYDEYRKNYPGLDYKALFNEIDPRYKELKKLTTFEVERTTPSLDTLRDYARNPETKTKETIKQLDKINNLLRGVKDAQINESDRITREIDEQISKGSALYHERKRSFLDKKARWSLKIELLKTLGTNDVRGSLAYGVINTAYLNRLEQHLAKQPEVKIKATGVSPSDSFIIISGPDGAKKWVDDLFLVFEVMNISTILGEDADTAVDPLKCSKVLEKYHMEMEEWVKSLPGGGTSFEEKVAYMEVEHQEVIRNLELEKSEKLKASEKQWIEQYMKVETDLKEKETKTLGEITFNYNLLRLAADTRAPVMRTKVFSIMQGWTPSGDLPDFKRAIEDVEKKVGEDIILEIETVERNDQSVPTPPPKITPAFLQGTWTLTTLRGWPTNSEINPAYISLLIFCFQFGIMFGDIGQGLIFFVLGIILNRKFKSGMVSKLGTLFIPMGLSAMIFGVLYDSIFLKEGILFHHHPILPNPMTQTTKLMLLVFGIAALEIIFGLILGAINQIRKGNAIGALGEHGVGMISYVGGFYLTALYFIQSGMKFFSIFNYWGFYLMIGGLILSFLEPVIHSVIHGHGIGMEVIGEGIAAFLMTFVEGMGNLFSFLRLVAFALAHASLAVAAEALSLAIPIIPEFGLIVMNLVALTFELISSSVQSLRLLYYEFMSKFYDGTGLRFRPFRLPKEK
jgi:vacuolar-type H+-ATPase subunit I/STV1